MESNRKGFTLIELIVVIFIISLFAGLSIANYGAFNEEKKLDDEVKRLSATLYLARSKASSADADPDICEDFRGFWVRLDTSTPSSYTSERDCNGTFDSTQTHALTSNVTIGAPITNVFFKSLNAGTNLSSALTIKVKNGKLQPAKCINIVIQPSGIFSESPKYISGC